MSLLKKIMIKYSIRRISKVLGEPARPGYDIFNRPDNSWEIMDNAKSELFKICQAQNNLIDIFEKYHVNDQKFKAVYDQLIDLGAGQWCGSRYVPVAALTTRQTVEFLLKYIELTKGEYKAEREMVFTVVMYFSGKIELPLKYNKYTDASTLIKR